MTADPSRNPNTHEALAVHDSTLEINLMPRSHVYLKRSTFGSLAVLTFAFVLAPSAAAHTCGSNWCSGSDSTTASNIQGNGPQVYIGEVDTYQHNFYGVGGPCPGDPNNMCWSTTGANNAANRYNAGTGIGVEDYYFRGGAAANNQGVTSYCWGAKQGYHETYDMYVLFNAWWPYQ
jgi:hypothetical protein